MISADKTHHMPRALQRARHILAAVGIVLLCIACGQPRPDPTIPIPIPSTAQAVQRVPGNRQLVQFTIGQTPEQVVAWYKQELIPQGWKIYTESLQSPAPGISFTSSGYRILFVLDVNIKSESNGRTFVEVELKPQPPA
jgi:hypothetical protein